jgi:hypothetical protein
MGCGIIGMDALLITSHFPALKGTLCVVALAWLIGRVSAPMIKAYEKNIFMMGLLAF